MRPKEIIEKQWREFQERMTLVMGAPMETMEARMHLERLLADYRRGMLESMVESWLPTEKLLLLEVVKSQAGSTQAAQVVAAPTKVRKSAEKQFAEL